MNTARNWRDYVRFLLAVILMVAGITHFVVPDAFILSVPSPFEHALFWIYVTGAAEVLAAIGLLIPRLRRLTAWILVLYFIALLPVHVEALLVDEAFFGFSDDGFMIARILFQLTPIWMAWVSRETDTAGVCPGLDHFDSLLKARWKKPFSWHSRGLLVAAFYNIGFGIWAGVFPGQAFQLFGMEAEIPLFLWQTVGMIVGVYGIGYGIAALNEQKHLPVILVGLLGKIFGPIGFVFTYLNGDISLSFGIMILLNDLIWYPLFFSICWRFFREKNPLERLT
ncbi:DoxX family protein [Balneolaceae bacterium ANBcel3]|nr:DoxX family protein [Balneolaceae bacterium ANBcel3]